MKIFGYTLAQLRKALVAVAGFVVTVIVAAIGGHLIPSGWEPYATVIVGVASTYGIFAVRNAPATPLDEPLKR